MLTMYVRYWSYFRALFHSQMLSTNHLLNQPQLYFLNHRISGEDKLNSHALGREKNDPDSGSKHSLHLITVSSRVKEQILAYLGSVQQ